MNKSALFVAIQLSSSVLANCMMHESGQFRSGAPKLKTKLWWQRTRLWVIFIIITIVVILGKMAGVCGLAVWVAVTSEEGVDVAMCGISIISDSRRFFLQSM